MTIHAQAVCYRPKGWKSANKSPDGLMIQAILENIAIDMGGENVSSIGQLTFPPAPILHDLVL